MYVGYIGKTLILVFILLSLSYFGGILWLLWSDFSQQYINRESEENFLDTYNLQFNPLDSEGKTMQDDRVELILNGMYFMFTTLSTVGFGDRYPRSDAERIICIFVFLMGVSGFSYIMGEFLAIIAQINTLNESLEMYDELS